MGLRCRCFDLTKRFSRQLRLALPKMCFRTGRDNLRGVADGLEESLKRPAAGQVKADATSCFADTRTDLEQLRAQGFDLCGAHRQRQLQAKQVDEVVGETVQQQAENIGSKAVTAQAVSGKTILEFFNAVLTLPAIVIEGKNGPAAAFQVGDQKAHVSSRFGVFGLVADSSLMRPAVSAIEKARKGSLRFARSTITPGETTLQGLRLLLQSRVGSYADHVLDAEKLAEFIEQWQSKTGVSAQFDAGFGELSLESRNDT